MDDHLNRSSELLRLASQGDPAALDQMLKQHRVRLRRMVDMRLNPRLRGRVDPSDILQEAYVEIARNLAEYLQDPKIPFYLWLRHITCQQVIVAHRRHLGAQKRAAGREISLHHRGLPEASSESIAQHLIDSSTAPAEAIIKGELQRRLQEALNSMEELDREVLSMRHFEQLSNKETAQVLEIDASACSNRYVRALKRLKSILSDVPGFADED